MRLVASSCAALLGLVTVAAGRAEDPAGPTGRAIEPVGRELLRAGLDRLAPALLARAEQSQSGVFVGRDGLTPAGRALVAFLQKARFHALDVALPPEVAALASRPAAPPPSIPPGALEAAWAEADGDGAARLDAAAQALRKRLTFGPDALAPEARTTAEAALGSALAAVIAQLPPRPRTTPVVADAQDNYLSPDTVWKDAPPPAAPAPEALAAAVAAARSGALDEHLAGLMPKHPQYAALVAAAERYDRICAAGEWPKVDAPPPPRPGGKPAKPDYPAPAVAALQARLAREGYLGTAPSGPTAPGGPTGSWDDATAAAVLEFRRTHHLKDKEPAFDKDLVRELDVPCAERLRTILLNVRRWRVSAWNGEPESVQVNLAGQVLRYFRDGALVMSQRTIVGSDKWFFSPSLGRKYWRNATPILHDTIATVIVNPEWNVPGRIARDELEPEIAKDPGYLDKHDFKVRVGGDGATYYIQHSGPGNALGRIKILFPNSESVYLHDTPGHAAFSLPVRALSHGCVRVQNAVDFGAELVRADKARDGVAFDVKTIKDIVAGSSLTHVFDLAHQVPVFLEYYTVSVDEAGALWFHPDIYGYDEATLHPELARQP